MVRQYAAFPGWLSLIRIRALAVLFISFRKIVVSAGYGGWYLRTAKMLASAIVHWKFAAFCRNKSVR
jgi:hypothetical protein